MRIVSGRAGTPSHTAQGTFTGEVWMDAVVTDDANVKINTVIFAPCARTFWHQHEHGQILQVFRGRGYVCVRDAEPRPIREGDTILIEPGEQHWHGGGADSLMGHTAITLGDTVWLEEVTSEEYAQASEG